MVVENNINKCVKWNEIYLATLGVFIVQKLQTFNIYFYFILLVLKCRILRIGIKWHVKKFNILTTKVNIISWNLMPRKS